MRNYLPSFKTLGLSLLVVLRTTTWRQNVVLVLATLALIIICSMGRLKIFRVYSLTWRQLKSTSLILIIKIDPILSPGYFGGKRGIFSWAEYAELLEFKNRYPHVFKYG